MLTGDKFETAENIARACKLIKPEFEVFRLKGRQDVAKYCSNEFVEQNENLI
jgi:magnesium-transporting ATPase (P-type)